MLTQVQYKKGHDERKAKYTSLPDPPEVVLAKTVDQQRSDVSRYTLNMSEMLYSRNKEMRIEVDKHACKWSELM